MKVLVIAPHHDDEILGVGGTIARYVAEGHEVSVCVVTTGSREMYSEDIVIQTRCETNKSHDFLGIKKSVYLDYPAAMLEEVKRRELNDSLIKLIQEEKPDEVFIPHRGDMQLDHKLTVDAAMVALRPKYSHRVKRILAYETLSETGWDVPNTTNEFIPNVYIDISMYLERKIEAMEFFKTQLSEFPSARSLGAIEALAKYRGATVNVMAAEAFSLVREIE